MSTPPTTSTTGAVTGLPGGPINVPYPGTAHTAQAVVPDDNRTHLRNRASWGAILAGMVAALVVQLLLNILGVGLGASSVDALNSGDNPTASTAGLTTAIWVVVSGIVASLVGGIVAGRLSGTSDGNTARFHGFLSWCAATLVIFYLLGSAVGGVIGGVASTLGSTVSAAGRGAATVVSSAASAAPGLASSGEGDALKAQVQRLVNPNDAQVAQDNITSYIRASVSGDKAAADAARDRAVDSLARAANVSPDEARNRLQQAESQARQAADQAKQKAQQAAEATRKGLASAGILGFVALFLGALAGWFGGGIGAPRAETTLATRRV